MKKLLLFIWLLTGLVGTAQNIQPKPNPPRLVNDFAGVLSADQRQALEDKLVAYDDSTSVQIAIIIISSTEGYDIQEVALKYLRDWGIGNAKTNNGVVLLAAINDRKVRIETGYGMEGAVPDVVAKSIIDNEIAPHFRTSNYYRGFEEATNAIIKASAGEYKAPEGYGKRGNKGKGSSALFIIIFIIILVVSMAGGGRGGGGMMSRRGISPWLIGPMIGGSGRGWSGGGGGFSGGGFGGFGGGGGGGGGASGSW